MSSPSPAMTMSAATPTATSTGSLSSGSTVSQPSSILFFIAVAIGVLIALLFLFFSLRYYVRSRMGIFATARITTLDSGVIIVSNDYPAQTLNAYTPDAFDIRAQRRRRRRYLKKRRLTEEELDHLFPVRTYQNWLDGGAEIDAKNRDIAAQLKEEHDEDVQHDEAEQEQAVSELPQTQDTANNEINVNNPNQELASSSSSNDHNHNFNKEIDLSNPFEAEMHFDSGTCAICIDTFEPEDQVRGLICGHVFHQECLDPWLTKRKACCPMCKRDYYMKNNRSEDGENDGNEADDNASMALPEVQYTTVSERVTEILSNHPEYQSQAEERIKRYMSRGYRFLWVIMGISVHDLLNSAIMELDYENSYAAEGRQRTEAAAAAAAAAASAADPSHSASDPTATSGDTALNSTSNPVSVESPSIAQIPTLTDVTVTHANIVDDRIDHSLESEAQASRDRISGTIV